MNDERLTHFKTKSNDAHQKYSRILKTDTHKHYKFTQTHELSAQDQKRPLTIQDFALQSMQIDCRDDNFNKQKSHVNRPTTTTSYHHHHHHQFAAIKQSLSREEEKNEGKYAN